MNAGVLTLRGKYVALRRWVLIKTEARTIKS